MDQFARHLFAIFIRLGGLGLLGLGILDSSFLFMPLGNDLLIVALTARRHGLMPYYAAMASVGSTLGALLVDLVFRKGGEEMLARHLPPKRMEYIKRKVRKRAAWALIIACLAPPPFPFTPFVMGASALQYPRKRLLAIIMGFRMVRFSVEGALAIWFGRHILSLAHSSVMQGFVFALLTLCIAGSIVSVVGWVRRSRRTSSGQPA